MSKKVFISGGCGFIGSNLTRILVSKGYEVMLFDAYLNFISPFISNYHHYLKERMKGLLDNKQVKIVRGDLRVQKRIQQVMSEYKPDAVVHLAALPSAKECTEFPTEALQINVDGTLSLLEGVKAAGSVKRFVFTSSSFVYGHFKKPIADEEHPTDPIDVYGGAKLTGEILTKSYGKAHGFEYTIVRPSAVYGFGDCNRRVTQILLENAIRKKPLILHDGGRSMIDFTHVSDVADGFARCIDIPEAANQIFNITRGRARSIAEYSEVVKKHFPEAVLESRPPDTSRPERGTLSIEKAKKLLNYAPKIDIEEGVADYVKQLKERGPKDLFS